MLLFSAVYFSEMASKKVTLEELKVTDLKRELEERDLDTSGLKITLRQRLCEALKQEGHDVSSYLFEVPCPVDAILQKFQEASNENLAAIQQKIQEASSENLAAMHQKLQEVSFENSAAMATMQQKLQETSAGISAAMSTMEQKLKENEKQVEERFENMESKINEIEMCMSKMIRSEVEQAISKTNATQILPQELINGRSIEEASKHEEADVMEPARVNLKPPQFDGTTSWNNYILQFEAAAKANRWAYSDKVTALILALRGEATAILETLSVEERTDYHQLVKRLEMRYGQANFEHVYHSQLRSRYQKSNESLQQFETDIARLVRLAYPGTPENVMERLAVQSFLDGLRDQEMRQALTLARPTTLVDALTRALEFEAAKQVSKSQARVRVVQEGSGSVDERRGFEGKKQTRCWNCGKMGHVQSRCKEERRAATSEVVESSEN